MDVLRDEKGRWLKGTCGGPGRLPRQREFDLQRAFAKVVTIEQFEAVTEKLISMAMEGNMQAIRLLYAYAIGKPLEKLQISHGDRDEYRVAGCSPAELGKEMLTRIVMRVQEWRDREREIEANRLTMNQPCADTKAPRNSSKVAIVSHDVTRNVTKNHNEEANNGRRTET